jgi:hypothetical protein
MRTFRSHGRHSLVEQLATGGLALRLCTPTHNLGDPHLEQVCRQTAHRGLVLTDVDGNFGRWA